jgi:hypothetical protein
MLLREPLPLTRGSDFALKPNLFVRGCVYTIPAVEGNPLARLEQFNRLPRDIPESATGYSVSSDWGEGGKGAPPALQIDRDAAIQRLWASLGT